MVRRSRLSMHLGVLVATTGLAFAPAPVYREPAKVPNILAAMQGHWEVRDDIDKTGEVKRVTQIRIRGTTWALIYDDSGVVRTKHEMVLDPKGTPTTLDLKQPDQVVLFGGGMVIPKRVAMKGIVKIEDDRMTFCYFQAPFDPQFGRPKDFVVGPQLLANGPNAVTMILKRVK